jgi:hypothetical protein
LERLGQMKTDLLHIVYLRSGPLLLTKKTYRDWREIQDEFDDYMASLGPWVFSDVIDFLREEYPNSFGPEQLRRIERFLESDQDLFEL